MSSDSEDDCYGNIAQRLQTVKSTFKEDKIDSTNLLIELKENEFTDYSWKKNDITTLDSECGTSENSGTAEVISLDAIIANCSKKRANRAPKHTAEGNTANILPKKKSTLDSECGASKNSGTAEIPLDGIIANNSTRATRAAKRAAQVDTVNILPEKKTRAKRGKNNAGKNAASASALQGPPAVPQVPQVQEEPQVSELSELPAIVPQTTNTQPEIPSIFGHIVNRSSLDTSQANSSTGGRGRGRGRSRGRGRQTTPRRGRGRRGFSAGRRTIWAMAQDVWADAQDEWANPLFNFAMALAASSAMSNEHNPSNRHSSNSNYDGPTYSVGNTDEYPDKSDNQPLFSSAPKPKPQNDVVIIENDQDLEDNEELSIKVYWQSSEVVKFNLRPFQRLTPIFDHFAEREKIPQDKLLFTYNDKILKSGDTPHSINYSIVKFIDGGVINQSVSSLIQDSIEDGIKLKFQCMNVKKPFLASIRANEKMQVVMMKCAEHFEKPLDKLKFYFDGDIISESDTPTKLDLEGGECIDVNIIS